jgi:hypothetical protein
MKKSIAGVLLLLAGASVSYGQGAVSLADYEANINTYIYVSYKPATGPTVLLGGPGTGAPTPTLSNYAQEVGKGSEWTVQLYGATGSGLSPSALSALVGASSTFANGLSGSGNDPVLGTWLSSSIYQFTGAPNGTVATVQLYAWYNDGGVITSYSQAVADGVPAGYSAPANVSLIAAPSPPAVLPDALGSFNVTAVPEPSTIALGVIGASTFLMRLRRKQ